MAEQERTFYAMNTLIWIWVSILSSVILTGGGLAYVLRAIHLSRAECENTCHETTVHLEAVAKEFGEWRRRLVDCEQRYSPAAESGSAYASLHLNRRGQVAQLFRRGQSPRSIASVLGISQGEVKLIIKMLDLDAVSENLPRRRNPTRKQVQNFDKASGVKAG